MLNQFEDMAAVDMAAGLASLSLPLSSAKSLLMPITSHLFFSATTFFFFFPHREWAVNFVLKCFICLYANTQMKVN